MTLPLATALMYLQTTDPERGKKGVCQERAGIC